MTMNPTLRSAEERDVARECCRLLRDKRKNGFWSKTNELTNYVRGQTLLCAELDIRAAFGLGADDPLDASLEG